MHKYGIHFPPVQQNKLETANLKRKREAVATKKQARLAKLPKLEQMPICCQRLCCCGPVDKAFLLDARSKYMDCTTQITRKAFLFGLKDINSPTNLVLAKGTEMHCL
jgi:hypothetical protein